MKKSIQLTLAFSLMLILFATPSSRALNVSVALSEGDTHEFTVHDLASVQKINGTDYSEPIADVSKGDKITTEVTGFTDEGSTLTHVNFTQTIGSGTSEEVSSLVDSWQYLYLIGILFLFVSGSAETGFDFSEPEEDDTIDIEEDAEGMPFFATNDEDAYIDFNTDLETQAGEATLKQGENVTEFAVESDLDTAANTYHMRFFYHFVIVGETDDGLDSRLDLSVDIITDIDYGRSLVTRMKLDVNFDITIDTATAEFKVLLDIYEGDNKPGGGDDGGIAGLPVNPLAALFGIAGLALVSRRIRK